jgi:hypothetical protein
MWAKKRGAVFRDQSRNVLENTCRKNVTFLLYHYIHENKVVINFLPLYYSKQRGLAKVKEKGNSPSTSPLEDAQERFQVPSPDEFLRRQPGGQSSRTISVKFAPTATGTRTATLNVNDGASNTSQTVALTGAGH